MAPSTSTPMEMAMPASDIRFAPIPMAYMGMKASATDTGMVTMGTMAEGMCHRKIRITIETITISSTSLCLTVPMACPMSSERS
ncbi:MAG: hypothetical protein H6Q88_3672 [Anaeromyxobacteraceae bacterium]|nr:hypothetical protein [Anaeromyxobacteraceae bacterium]